MMLLAVTAKVLLIKSIKPQLKHLTGNFRLWKNGAERRARKGFSSSFPCSVLRIECGASRFLRLRGVRSCADGARGTCPSGLPSIACGQDGGFVRAYGVILSCKR